MITINMFLSVAYKHSWTQPKNATCLFDMRVLFS